ncbi:hypothetical protein K431DRAFT_289619 [Polychaeton citri CBS 116435]|uniref:Ubiquitination network signaling protein n=1 Tax=Polychaeton citri CBS 116435 TaxID=1314669 RepID=A0A9P4UHW7_9PEZI|nr:hypothetical protein K431DRAFT_289619 [Polychaeton citri CBS 116435]
MPPKGKRGTIPNQHDKRHEGGLAAPGKRVSKQRSNGNLNGLANGKPVQSVAPPPLPSSGLNQGFTFTHSKDSSADPTAQQPGNDYDLPTDGVARDRTGSDTSVGDIGPFGDMAAESGANETLPRDGPQAPAAYPPPAGNHAAGGLLAPLSMLVPFRPLYDAIAILTLLLILPTVVVNFFQAVFASLMFGPSSSSVASLSSMPKLKDMLNASNLGNPALFTIAVVDLLFYLGFLMVWKPLQDVLLDLSQVFMAISLSGAAATDEGPTYSIATCSLVVCVVHVLRYKAIHLTALDYLRSVIHKLDIPVDVGNIAVPSSFLSHQQSSDFGWLEGFLRGALGIHIVATGVTNIVRSSLAKANERNLNLPAITKTDPEAAAGAEQPQRSGSVLADGTQMPLPASSAGDGPAVRPSPTHRESKIRESSTKRKRKQAIRLQTQQPLWAAFASTKVTFAKESEKREAANDGREAVSKDTNTNAFFANSIQSTTTGRIWICELRDTEISCTVELSPEAADESVERMEEGMGLSAGIDKTKPFFVRLNGAVWSSVRILSGDGGGAGEGNETRSFRDYQAEICGLAPRSTYEVEVVGIATGRVLCSTSWITQPAQTPEQSAAAPTQPPHPTLRPSSPTTTLKQSIQSSEVKLSEIRAKAKKMKKDQKAANADIKKEIAALRSKMESSGGMDDRHRNRLTQIRQHKNQAEEAADDVKEQIAAFSELPPEEAADAESRRKVWQAAKDSRAAALKDFENGKAAADQDFSQVRNELATSEAKREKLNSRHAQKVKELEKAKSEQEEKKTAIQKHEMDRMQRQEQREGEEAQLRHHIGAMDAESQNLQQKGMESYSQILAMQNWSAQPPNFQGYSSPPTPEGAYATVNSNGNISPQMQNGFSSFGTHNFYPVQQPLPHPVPRGRSSSMLSQYSGFTDDADPYIYEAPPKQHSWPMQQPVNAMAAIPDTLERNNSEGSGYGPASGSASGSGGGTDSTASSSPRADAKPFVPTRMNPIGPPTMKR